jgi:hypothetical protein
MNFAFQSFLGLKQKENRSVEDLLGSRTHQSAAISSDN